MQRKLAVFDFDHTIVDGNSDIVARKLLRNDQIPENVRVMYHKSGWTIYMQEIFKLLKKHRISKDTLKRAIEKIPEVRNMKKLLAFLSTALKYDVIIISDSNSSFIDWWLEGNNVKKYVNKIFTNPADYDKDGLLRIDGYHIQNECNLSTQNLCKGRILKEFLSSQKDGGIEYSRILYAGDGKNDLCPILTLKETDVACIRKGYVLEKTLLDENKIGWEDKNIDSEICFWNDGDDIINYIS